LQNYIENISEHILIVMCWCLIICFVELFGG